MGQELNEFPLFMVDFASNFTADMELCIILSQSIIDILPASAKFSLMFYLFSMIVNAIDALDNEEKVGKGLKYLWKPLKKLASTPRF
jgi:hypothetical protein